ncbi:hypothetical protein AB7M32_004250 [Pseudomonas sp. R151218B TE3479]
MLSTQDTLVQRIHRELLDHSDEELELELSEDGHDLNALFDEHAPDNSEKESDACISANCSAFRANW